MTNARQNPYKTPEKNETKATNGTAANNPSPLESKEVVVKTTPLSLKSKKILWDVIKEGDKKQLVQALVEAALAHHTFPQPYFHVLSQLQISYQLTKTNPSVNAHIKNAITEFIHLNGINLLSTAAANEALLQEWQSHLLLSITKKLKVKTDDTFFVEMTIVNAKVHWQILKSDNTIIPRTKTPLDFSKYKTILISWELFRHFKDGGKRSGTVEITADRFATELAKYNKAYLKLAPAIWAELHQKGVLNSRNRLSNSFRSTTNYDIKLQTTSNKLLLPLIFKSLYKVANNEAYQEKIDGIPNTFIFRPERNFKQCAMTGRVTNDIQPDGDDDTMLFDVGTHHDLTLHSCDSEEAKKQYPIELDHIPSSGILKDAATSFYQYQLEKETEIKQQIKAIEKSIGEETKKHPAPSSTRSVKIRLVSDELLALEEKKKNLNTSLTENMFWKNIFSSECHSGSDFWTIAIPEKLHAQGDTFLKKLSEQKKSPMHFLTEIQIYLNILEKHAGDFSLRVYDYLKFLGAVRTLLRSQIKPPSFMNNKVPIGATPHSFFYNRPNTISAMDKLLMEKLEYFLEKVEGHPQPDPAKKLTY